MDTFIPTPATDVRTAARQDATRPLTPGKHCGFAQIPRLITRGDKFKQFSLVEVGLYTCLKDICGETGECYYTLRNLASLTRTSISTLSRYIPKLRDAGAITAEKRPGTKTKHDIWHIRIVNIWAENDALYAPDRFNEQQSFVSNRNKVQKKREDVSNRNESVSNRNEKEESQAQDCFNLTSRRIREEEYTKKEEVDSFVVSAKAENDGMGVSSLLSKLSSFEECLEDVQQHIQEEAPVDLSASPKEEVRLEELQVDTLPEQNTNGHTRKVTEPLTQQVTLLASLSQEGRAKTPSPDKTDEKGKNKKRLGIKECSPEIQARRRKWQAYFNTRRGGEPLKKAGACQDEAKAVIDLVDDFTDAQIQAIDTFVLTERFPYKKPSDRHRAGGRVILDEAQNARERLKELGQWPGSTGTGEAATSPPDDSFSCIPEGYNAADEFGEYYGISEKREAEYAAL